MGKLSYASYGNAYAIIIDSYDHHALAFIIDQNLTRRYGPDYS
ncbi:unnamed protein product [Amoebophrya sp. A25]|nr:unnamed protein product [Amoebophrya sp. A25]|eukprot:GSA25T00006654001.1